MTCTASGECTVRNHDHLRVSSDTEETLVKTGCPGGFVSGSIGNDGSGGQLWSGISSPGDAANTESPAPAANPATVTVVGGYDEANVRPPRHAAESDTPGSIENHRGDPHGAHGVLPQPRAGKAWKDRQAPRFINTHREIL